MSKKCVAEKLRLQFTYQGNISSYTGLEERCRRMSTDYKSRWDYTQSPFRFVKVFTFADSSKLTFMGDDVSTELPPLHAGLFNRQ